MKTFKKSILCLLVCLMLAAGIQPLYAQNDSWKTAQSNVEGGLTYYVVNFVTDEGLYLTALVNSGGLVLPEAPHREGYTFLRWECEGRPVTDGMSVNHDLTITAVFEPIVLVDTKILYVYEEGGKEVVFGTHSATLTLDDVKTGAYTVVSPEYTEVSGVRLWPERKSVSITAEDLSAAAGHGNSLSFTVSYMPADLSYTLVRQLTALNGSGYDEIDRSELSGRMGDEISAPAETAFGTLIRVENKELTQSGQVITAIYQRKALHLTFDTNGGRALPGPEVLYGGSADLSEYTPVRDGYTFSGWLDEGNNPVSGEIVLTADRTLRAQWKAAESSYSVVYYKETLSGDYEYAETETRSGETGTEVTVSSDLAAPGKYKGYEPDEARNAASKTVISGDGRAVLPVYYKLQSYTFSFSDPENTSYAYSFSAKLGEDIASRWPTAAEMSSQNANFYGWKNGTITYVTKRITVTEDMLPDSGNEVALTAEWTTETAKKQVNYWLQNPDGKYVKSEALSQEIYSSGNLGAKEITGFTHNAEKDQHTENEYNFFYDRSTYKFEYYDGGTKLKDSDPILFEANVSSDYTPERTGLSFAGWYADSGLTAPYHFTTMPGHNAALYAGWKAQVSFEAENGTETREVAYGQPVMEPSAPVWPFHTFTGWYTARDGGNRWNFAAPVTENVTLYAHFTENVHSCIVRYLAAESGQSLHADKIITGAEIGETVTEQAVRIAGWLAEQDQISRTVQEDPSENILIFRYTKAPETISYKVSYLRSDDHTPVQDAVVRTVSGDRAIVYEFAPNIPGLYAEQLLQSISLTTASNEIVFYYNDYKTAVLNVRKLDMDGGMLNGPAGENFALRIGESFNGHIGLEGYTWDHAAGDVVFTPDEADAGRTFEMELYYRKNLTLTPEDLTKPFDGEALMNEGTAQVIAEGLAEGHRIADVVFSGSQTEIGSSASLITSVTISGPKSGNDFYAVTCEEGTLTVTEAAVLKAVPMFRSLRRTLSSAGTVQTAGDFTMTFDEPVTFDEAAGTYKDNKGNLLAEYHDGVLKVFSGNIRVANINPDEPTNERIEIVGNATLTLAGVNISTGYGEESPISVYPDVTATILLDKGSENTLDAKETRDYRESEKKLYASFPAIHLWYYEDADETPHMANLIIDSVTDEYGKKSGVLNAFGGDGSAGIGGAYYHDMSSYKDAENKAWFSDKMKYYGDITINGGTLNVTAIDAGAAIGSAGNDATSHGSYKTVANWGTITINCSDDENKSTVINAVGGGRGAGIGGGNHTDSGKIIINGGTIDATGSSGIGSGLGSSNASGTEGAYSKGPGWYYGDVEIYGGDIHAVASGHGAGIGGGMYSDAIVVIGCHENENGNELCPTIYAQGNAQNNNNYHHGSAGIGGGYEGHAQITITGGTINALGWEAGAGIGSGGSPNANPDRGSNGRIGPSLLSQTTVNISGGTITAAAGQNGGAGIGGGTGADKVTVNISGGTVTAFGAASCNPDEEGCSYMTGGAGIGGGTDGYNALTVDSSENKKYFVMTDLDISITGGNVVAIGGWGASGIGSGAEVTGAHVYTDKTKITTSPDANIIAYADGTKFAIDTRLLQDDNTTLSKEQAIAGNVLQGTFVHAYTLESGVSQDPEGLPVIKIFDSLSGELAIPALTGMKDHNLAHYRSFAATVPHPGEYLVYTDADTIGSGGENGRYFACSTYDIYNKDALLEEIRYQVETGRLSDNFYLYPVKSIIVRKTVSAPEGMDLTGIDKELTFSLKTRDAGQDGETFRSDSITIQNGEAQNIAAFVNVPDNAYEVWEEPGIGSEISGSFGTLVLKDIKGASTSGDNNNGVISADQWSDSISFENVYETPTPTPETPTPTTETPTPTTETPTPEPPDETDEPEESPTPVITETTPAVTATPTETATPTPLIPTPTPSKTLFPIITSTETVTVPRETPTPPPTEPVPDNPPDPEYPELVYAAPESFIEDYSVPLGLGQINLNAADCFE